MGSELSRATGAASVLGFESRAVPILLLTCATLLAYVGIRRGRTRYPPGPRGWPIVGNAFELPKEHEWVAYQRWSREFQSDILYYSSWGNSFVVLNSLEAATDLLERRSALYADRPRMPMLNDLCGFGWDMGLMPYDEDWKLSRKLFTQHFRQSESGRYRDEEVRCARELLRDILGSPAAFSDHIRLMFGKLIMSVTYGIDVRSSDDEYISIAQKALNAINMTGNVGTYLVDSIPLLKHVPEWFPGASFKREARKWKVDVKAMVNKPYETAQKVFREGTARPSVIQALFEELGVDLNGRQELAVKSATGTAYEAGSETTWSAVLSVVLVAILFPEVQKKVHDEVDRVVGRERFPDFADQASLPYTVAVCKEVLRWSPPLPLAVMHRLTKDDTYRGYHLPGGSTVVLNSWAILHDETLWPNPDAFVPERFLTNTGELNTDAPDPEAAFGFGRRACAGRHMAQDSLWMTAVSLLWAFDIEKAVDENGVPIDVSAEYSFGVVSYPKFQCQMKARSTSIESLVHSVSYAHATSG